MTQSMSSIGIFKFESVRSADIKSDLGCTLFQGLASDVTWYFLSKRVSTSFEPINPVAPVTSSDFVMYFLIS